jgi:tetratricopeptide (TPR) repeat protein
MVRFHYVDLMNASIRPFQQKMIKIIKSEDEDIKKQRIEFSEELDSIQKINLEDNDFLQKAKNRDLNKEILEYLATELALNGLDKCYLKRYDDASICYGKAIFFSPEVPGLWAALSLSLQAQKKSIGSLRAYKKAIDLIPGGPQIKSVENLLSLKRDNNK